MQRTARLIAALVAATPLIVLAQTATSGPEGPVSPNAPGGSSPQPTIGRMNTATGVDATDTRKNAATKRASKKPLVRKPADSDLPDPSDRPNGRSRKDGAAG